MCCKLLVDAVSCTIVSVTSKINFFCLDEDNQAIKVSHNISRF